MKKLSAFLLLFFLIFNLFAQNNQDSIKTVNQPKVIIYGEKTIEKSYYSESEIDRERSRANKLSPENAVKIAPLLIIFGDFPIFYERKLNEMLSVEGGVGVTIRNIGNEVFGVTYFTDEELLLQDMVTRSYIPGFSLNTLVKIYPNKDVMDGFYFGPEIRYRRYNSQATYGRMRPGSEFKEFSQITEGKITIGYVNAVRGNLILEIYTGLGVRVENSTQAILTGNTSSGNLRFELKEQTSYLPSISGGIKFGVFF